MKCVRKDCVEMTRPGKQPTKMTHKNVSLSLPTELVLRIPRIRGICKPLPFPCSVCRDNVVQTERPRDRAFRTRFHTYNNARNAPRTLRTKFRKIRNLEIRVFWRNRDFEESEVPRIQKFIPLPFPCSASTTSCRQ